MGGWGEERGEGSKIEARKEEMESGKMWKEKIRVGEKDKSKHPLKIKFVFSRQGIEDKTSRLSSACLRDMMNLNRRRQKKNP